MPKPHAQYFTVDDTLQQTVFDLVRNRGEKLLEPSFGAGHLAKKFLEHDPHYPMQLIEIDATIVPIVTFAPEHQHVIYTDFILAEVDAPFRTIIANPPYMKRKGARNLYIDFIEKCWNALDPDGGEMIFIVPSEFLKQTRAAPLINMMWDDGIFTNFHFPNDETLFNKASIDVVVFRYQRCLEHNDKRPTNQEGMVFDRTSNTTILTRVNGVEQRIINANGVITFADVAAEAEAEADVTNAQQIGDVCDVFVGIVSGMDAVFRNEDIGNIDVLTDENVVHKFIQIDKIPSGVNEIDEYMESHKDALMTRRIRKFSDKNWFEWGALRNVEKMRALWGRECVYVRNLTRKEKVAFKGTVQYFGGSLICIVPNDEGQEDTICDTIVETLNSAEYRKNYTYSGRFKIGQKQVSVSAIRVLHPV